MQFFFFLLTLACACVFSCFSHVRLFCNPTDSSPPGSSVHGILQARILEWFAVPSSRGSSQPRDQTCLLHWQMGSLPLLTKHHLGSPNIVCFYTLKKKYFGLKGSQFFESCLCLSWLCNFGQRMCLGLCFAWVKKVSSFISSACKHRHLTQFLATHR